MIQPRRPFRDAPLLLAVLLSVAAPGFGEAVSLEQGDALVIALNRVVHVAAVDSQQTVVVELPTQFALSGIDVTLGGTVYVTGWPDGVRGQGHLFRIDSSSGAYTIAAQSGALANPMDVVVTPGGDLIIPDPGAFGGVGAILKIGETSGTQDVLVSSSVFKHLVSVAIGAPGVLYFLDAGDTVDGVDMENAVYRLDMETLDTTLVSRGGLLQHGRALAYADGFLYLPDLTGNPGGGSIVRLDPATGAQSVLTSSDLLSVPVSAARRSVDCLAVLERELPGFNEAGVVCVSPMTGEQSRVATYRFMAGLIDMTIYKGGLTPTRPSTWGELKARYR